MDPANHLLGVDPIIFHPRTALKKPSDDRKNVPEFAAPPRQAFTILSPLRTMGNNSDPSLRVFREGKAPAEPLL
jgi:hypothetical protein